jgi:hypothetical protein
LELEAMTPGSSCAPIQPLLAGTDTNPDNDASTVTDLLDSIGNNPHFLNVYTYANEEELLGSVSTKVLDPLEERLKELPKRRATDRG